MTARDHSLRRQIFHFDGGCRPNPGPIEIAVVHRGTVHVRTDIGEGDNNDAEWRALLLAVELACAVNAQDVVFVGDSAVVVGQASGRARCRSPHLQPYRDAFVIASADLPRWHVRLVPRSRNLAGIALSQQERDRATGAIRARA